MVEQSFKNIANALARTDSKIAMDWLARLPEGEARNSYISGLCNGVAQNSPLAAAWVSRFSEGSLRENAMQNLINGWARNDSAGASKWLQDLPVGKSRDRAI